MQCVRSGYKSPKVTEEEMGTRHFFIVATTTMQQRVRASWTSRKTRTNKPSVKIEVATICWPGNTVAMSQDKQSYKTVLLQVSEEQRLTLRIQKILFPNRKTHHKLVKVEDLVPDGLVVLQLLLKLYIRRKRRNK